ncbi:MAG: hypothetical protein WD557_19490 [Dehalococcoidia bacterium]
MANRDYNQQAALRRLHAYRLAAPTIDADEVRALLAAAERDEKPYADSSSYVTVRQCKKELKRPMIRRSGALTRTLSSAA